jgi:hypothetical protein
METEQMPFVADTDPLFLVLRPDLRNRIRNAEIEFRRVISEIIPPLPAYPDIVAHAKPSMCEMPAQMIRALIGYFQIISGLQDQAEKLEVQQTKPGRVKPNLN